MLLWGRMDSMTLNIDYEYECNICERTGNSLGKTPPTGWKEWNPFEKSEDVYLKHICDRCIENPPWIDKPLITHSDMTVFPVIKPEGLQRR